MYIKKMTVKVFCHRISFNKQDTESGVWHATALDPNKGH